MTFTPTIWLADLTYTQQTIAADVILGRVGGIATYIETKVAIRESIRVFKYPEKPVIDFGLYGLQESSKYKQ